MNIIENAYSINSLGTGYFLICVLIGCGLAVVMVLITSGLCDKFDSSKPWLRLFLE